jgi:hypothetical protein
VRTLIVVLRFAVVAAIVAAIAGQLATSVRFWRSGGIDDVTVQVVNFFSFFTVESNAAAAVVLAIGGVLLLVRRGHDSEGFTLVRASVVTYMVVTGIVYNLLLRGIELPQGSTLAWSNEILHVVAPLYLLVDWVVAPGRVPLAARRLWPVLIFPIAWVVYSLVRGPFVADAVSGNSFWYPYPFLNPETSANGYLSVAFYVVLIAVLIAIVAAGVLWVSRRRTTPLTR